MLKDREVQKIYLRDLGAGTRAEIVAAFDSGPGLVSYVGHGATAVWASENVFNNTDVSSLSAQGQQPLLLTLNCLNGFFHFPPFDSLAEALLKAEGKGAIAAFSPSGLSLDEAAHDYHKALLAEIESGRHARLGDAVLAAQSVLRRQRRLPRAPRHLPPLRRPRHADPLEVTMHMPTQRTREGTPSPGHIRRGLGLALLALALPGLAEAVPYVKSVEYVEIPIGNLATTATVNLTKGQVVANCVPFASMMTSGVDDQFDQFFTDVFFQAAPPARVTAQRFTAGGTLSVGVFVVEFDPAYVNVRQGPFAMGAGTATTTAAIPATTLTKAALVSYYQHGAVTNSWTDYAIAGWFSAGNQLMWQRNFSAGAVSGHYYVFEARNTEFSVQAVSFGIANNATSANQAITAVDMDKTMVIASYRTAYSTFDNEDGQIGVFLANPTTLTAQRTFETGASSTIDDIRAFVVQWGDNVRVQRGVLNYADADTFQTATIRAVDLASTMVWNGSSIGPGTMENETTTASNGDTAFQRLKLTNATTVRGDRDGTCAATDCQGIGHFEVVEWNPSGQMLVKSGLHIGTGANDQPVFVGFQPDVVFIKFDVNGTWSLVRTSTMAADNTKSLDAAGVALLTNRIKSFTSQGFTLGTSADVNSLGNPYYWIAFKAAPGELKVGTYIGNNTPTTPRSGRGLPARVRDHPPRRGRGARPAGEPLVDHGRRHELRVRRHRARPPRQRDPGHGGGRLPDRQRRLRQCQPGDLPLHRLERGPRPRGGGLLRGRRDGRPQPGRGGLPAGMGSRQESRGPSPLGPQAGLHGPGRRLQPLPSPTSRAPPTTSRLRPLGFQVAFGPELPEDRTNEAGITYHWIAFGPHQAQVNYRSIGTAAAYGTAPSP